MTVSHYVFFVLGGDAADQALVNRSGDSYGFGSLARLRKPHELVLMAGCDGHFFLELDLFWHPEMLLTTVLLEEFGEVGVLPMLRPLLMLLLQHRDLCGHTHSVYLSQVTDFLLLCSWHLLL